LSPNHHIGQRAGSTAARAMSDRKIDARLRRPRSPWRRRRRGSRPPITPRRRRRPRFGSRPPFTVAHAPAALLDHVHGTLALLVGLPAACTRGVTRLRVRPVRSMVRIHRREIVEDHDALRLLKQLKQALHGGRGAVTIAARKPCAPPVWRVHEQRCGGVNSRAPEGMVWSHFGSLKDLNET
jgi:hypothetical protein